MESILIYIRTFFKEIFSRKPLQILATFHYKNGKLQHYNWGDDMNFYFFEDILGKKVINTRYSLINRNRDRFLVIGSTISMLTDRNTIIWGGGVIGEDVSLLSPPKEVLAVRGPLSRNFLLSKGVPCPEVYGDPVLLLKYFYFPKQEKKYELGIIPHICEYDDSRLDNLKNDSRVLFINMKGYLDWHDVIDLVCQCKFIVSSSLHGLVLAESYGIPNKWMKLSNKLRGGEFKFHDFFGSLNKNNERAVDFSEIIPSFEQIINLKEEYVKGVINLAPLINSAPLEFGLPNIIKLSSPPLIG